MTDARPRRSALYVPGANARAREIRGRQDTGARGQDAGAGEGQDARAGEGNAHAEEAADGPPRVPDALWAAVVLDLAAAHRHATISRDHLVRAAVPLYLGRVASFAADAAGLATREAAERLEALCVQFER